MTNPRIEKVKADIEKTKARVLGYQARLRALERLKIILENAEIVAFVRGEMISDAELGVLMKSIRGEDTAEIEEMAEPRATKAYKPGKTEEEV
jgi:hypothetical protein